MGKIGNKLREIREKKGMSKEKVSELAGISTKTLYRYEKNRAEPTLKVLKKLALVLDIPLCKLLKDEIEFNHMDKNVHSGTFVESNSVESGLIKVEFFEDLYLLIDNTVTNSDKIYKIITLSEDFIKSLNIKKSQNINVVRIADSSILPFFEKDDHIIIEKVNSFNEVKNGNIIIFTVDKELYVKRVRKELPDHTIFLTNIDGNDSHSVELKEELLKRLNLIGIIRGKYKAL
jgi:transcriptional regulator with XRE-family HTH domain